jgi:hypothetical protein
MNAKKISLIVVGVVLLAIAGSVFYVMTNLDALVKAAIEKYGSEATKTAVRVSSVAIRLTEGSGEINGLTVANPHGFASPHVFSLGKISTKIDVHSVTKSPIVIDELHIATPQVVYEMNQELASNILVLKKNLQASAASTKKQAVEEKKASGSEPKKEIKILIKKLVMDSGTIMATVAAYNNKPQTVTLKRFEMNNIGGKDGATPAKIAEEIVTALAEQVSVAVAQAGLEKYGVRQKVDKEVDRAVNRLLGN